MEILGGAALVQTMVAFAVGAFGPALFRFVRDRFPAVKLPPALPPDLDADLAKLTKGLPILDAIRKLLKEELAKRPPVTLAAALEVINEHGLTAKVAERVDAPDNLK